MANESFEGLPHVMDRDLAGYQLRILYYVEPDHGLWDTRPAIFWPSKRMVVTLDEELLKKVIGTLPNPGMKVNIKSFLALVHMQHLRGISLEGDKYSRERNRHFQIMSEEEFDAAATEASQEIVWAP